MFTKNYYNLLALSRMVNLGTVLPLNFTALDGNVFNGFNQEKTGEALAWYETSSVITTTDQGLIFGNGTTPPTLEDSTLSGETITTLSQVSVSSTVTATQNGYQCKVTVIMTNTGSEEVTISEVCRTGLVPFSTATSSRRRCVLERVVLDEPVVIPAGGNGTVEYITTIEIPG